MKAGLHWDIYDFTRFKSFEELYKYADGERKKAKGIGGYQFDNQNHYLFDIFGVPQAKLGIHEQAVTFYSLHGYSLISYSQDEYTQFIRDTPKILENLAARKCLCNQCGKWKLTKNMKPYSFAGIVCNKCYDPKVHKGPDTRGD
jgi:hypothetical protein